MTSVVIVSLKVVDGFIEFLICFRVLYPAFFRCVWSIFPRFGFITYFPKRLTANDSRRLDESYSLMSFIFCPTFLSSFGNLGTEEAIPWAPDGRRMTKGTTKH